MVVNFTCVASYMAFQLQRCIDAYLVAYVVERTALSCETEDGNLFNP